MPRATCHTVLETAFRKNFDAVEDSGDEYHLLLSPGDFAAVPPSLYSDEDYLPHHTVAHDYTHEIKTAWKKTANGFTGDIAIPAMWFRDSPFPRWRRNRDDVGRTKIFPGSPPPAMASEFRISSSGRKTITSFPLTWAILLRTKDWY